MKYIKNDWKISLKKLYLFGISTYVGVGLLLFYLIYYQSPHPTRPIAYTGWYIVNFAIGWCLIGAPLYFLISGERIKRHNLVAHYRFLENKLIMITPKNRVKKIAYASFRKLFYPYLEGTPFKIKWRGSSTGEVVYLCNGKILDTKALDTKAGYRVLMNYLRWVREHPEDFKATIQWTYDSDEWRKDDTLKKSLRKRDEKIWLEFLDEWWKRQERGKDYWLKTPLEKILKDLHSPYTLEELDNPSEDELVEIDESKLIEEKC